MIRALVEVLGSIQDDPVMINFEALPLVGQCMEVPVELLGLNGKLNPDDVWGWPGVDNWPGVSLRVQQIFWQPFFQPGQQTVMMPVILASLSSREVDPA